VGSLDTFWRSVENISLGCEFVPQQNDDNTSRKRNKTFPTKNQQQKQRWCVPLIPTNGIYDSNTSSPPKLNLYPIGDLTDPHFGYPPDQVPPSIYSARYGMLWVVSQAAPLRRLHIHGNLHLSLGEDYASGGYVTNTLVEDGCIQMATTTLSL
jgi:hypothetical protein